MNHTQNPDGSWSCVCGWAPRPGAARQAASLHRHLRAAQRAAQ